MMASLPLESARDQFEERSGGVSERKSRLFFGSASNFLFLRGSAHARNLKFLTGNFATDGDTNTVAQHLSKGLSMALYGLRTL
jgi:hypothetical protein